MLVHSIRQGSEGMISMSLQLFKMKYYFEDYGCLKCGKKNECRLSKQWAVQRLYGRGACSDRSGTEEVIRKAWRFNS
jgi:hypothetical protein